MVVPFAHLGHLLIDLPVFLGPILGLCGWLFLTARRGRRNAGHRREQR
jgi:hypothetical protein